MVDSGILIEGDPSFSNRIPANVNKILRVYFPKFLNEPLWGWFGFHSPRIPEPRVMLWTDSLRLGDGKRGLSNPSHAPHEAKTFE